MKITKTEGIWLIITTILYIAYNIPGVPPYNQPTATLIHAALTVLPIWVITYIFLHISAKPKEDDEHIYGQAEKRKEGG